MMENVDTLLELLILNLQKGSNPVGSDYRVDGKLSPPTPKRTSLANKNLAMATDQVQEQRQTEGTK